MCELKGRSYMIGSYSFSTVIIFSEMVLFVSLSLSVDSQLMLFNCNSVFPVSSIPGGSEGVSSVLCTWLTCLGCFVVLLLYLCCESG